MSEGDPKTVYEFIQSDIDGIFMPRVRSVLNSCVAPNVSRFGLANALHKRHLRWPKWDGLRIEFSLMGDRPHERTTQEAMSAVDNFYRRVVKETVMFVVPSRQERFNIPRNEIFLALHGHEESALQEHLRLTFLWSFMEEVA